jgi:hypothetical protein
MKNARSIGRSRNSRLNALRKALSRLVERLEAVAGTPHDTPILEAEFWEDGRDLVTEIGQCLHEANAYNNCLVPDGVKFERDVYEPAQK